MTLYNPGVPGGKVKAGTFVNRLTDGVQAITGLGFAPEFLIVCSAEEQENIAIFDGIRQVSYLNTALIVTNVLKALTDASNQITGNFTSLDADGFTITWSSLVGTAPGRTYFYLAVAK